MRRGNSHERNTASIVVMDVMEEWEYAGYGFSEFSTLR